jgi:transposase
MKVATRFITDVSQTEMNKLTRIWQTESNFRLRNRAHAILLSAEGRSINEISQICGVGRDAVSDWLSRWESNRCEALADAERSGRPPTLTEAEEAAIVATALKMPHSPSFQRAAVQSEIGKPVSRDKLRRLLKKNIGGNESNAERRKSGMK